MWDNSNVIFFTQTDSQPLPQSSLCWDSLPPEVVLFNSQRVQWAETWEIGWLLLVHHQRRQAFAGQTNFSPMCSQRACQSGGKCRSRTHRAPTVSRPWTPTQVCTWRQLHTALRVATRVEVFHFTNIWKFDCQGPFVQKRKFICNFVFFKFFYVPASNTGQTGFQASWPSQQKETKVHCYLFERRDIVNLPYKFPWKNVCTSWNTRFLLPLLLVTPKKLQKLFLTFQVVLLDRWCGNRNAQGSPRWAAQIHSCLFSNGHMGIYTETCLLSNGHTEKFYDWI